MNVIRIELNNSEEREVNSGLQNMHVDNRGYLHSSQQQWQSRENTGNEIIRLFQTRQGNFVIFVFLIR